MNSLRITNKILVFSILLALLVLGQLSAFGFKRSAMLYPKQVNKFYAANGNHSFWYTANPFSGMIRDRFMQRLDSAALRGLNRERYHYSDIKARSQSADSSALAQVDKLFTDALIAYSKDLNQGANAIALLNNDEVTPKQAAADDEAILSKLASVTTVPAVDAYLATLERPEPEIALLENEFRAALAANNNKLTEQLQNSLAYYRWLKHFNFDRHIVVNIPAATLRYYEGDQVKLEMKVVVGKPETKTPRFSSYCREVILYPYWNVPKSISTKELLPKFKKNPGELQTMNMEVVDMRGRVVEGVDFASYDRYDFPYTFRQYTGCDNALGVIKFNLTNPFDVYLHDTNNKLAFKKDARFLSHGCVRVEKPIELANVLLENEIDEGFIRACIHDQKPISKPVKKGVPVFVVYMTADVVSDSVKYYKDIYKLL